MLLDLIFAARMSAAQFFAKENVPSESIVLAIIQHETRGNAKQCKDEKDGSSSWGLMQLNHKHSKCADMQFAKDFEPERNIRIGVYILTLQTQWCKERHTGHDPLMHYAGTGPAAVRFAQDIRALAAKIERDWQD